MAAQIAAHYGSKVTLTCANLAREEKPELEPLRTDTLTIAGKGVYGVLLRRAGYIRLE